MQKDTPLLAKAQFLLYQQTMNSSVCEQAVISDSAGLLLYKIQYL